MKKRFNVVAVNGMHGFNDPTLTQQAIGNVPPPLLRFGGGVAGGLLGAHVARKERLGQKGRLAAILAGIALGGTVPVPVAAGYLLFAR